MIDSLRVSVYNISSIIEKAESRMCETWTMEFKEMITNT